MKSPGVPERPKLTSRVKTPVPATRMTAPRDGPAGPSTFRVSRILGPRRNDQIEHRNQKGTVEHQGNAQACLAISPAPDDHARLGEVGHLIVEAEIGIGDHKTQDAKRRAREPDHLENQLGIGERLGHEEQQMDDGRGSQKLGCRGEFFSVLRGLLDWTCWKWVEFVDVKP